MFDAPFLRGAKEIVQGKGIAKSKDKVFFCTDTAACCQEFKSYPTSQKKATAKAIAFFVVKERLKGA